MSSWNVNEYHAICPHVIEVHYGWETLSLYSRLTASLKAAISGSDFSNRSEIGQVPGQQRCRDACQISERYNHCNTQSRGFETWGKTSYCLVHRCPGKNYVDCDEWRHINSYFLYKDTCFPWCILEWERCTRASWGLYQANLRLKLNNFCAFCSVYLSEVLYWSSRV